jgi:serine/threonine-protein kinase
MGAASATTANSFGKYSLVAKLATGGMAEIFLARLSGAAGFEKLVVVKRILPHLAKDQNLVGMFLAEAKIAAQISHHNVCQVFELGEIDGRYFIAMEYLEGVPFSCFRRRDMFPPPPDPRLVASLGVQACEGLHHAHQLRRADGQLMEVVHRDVSSNNLFATVDGVVKVLDFGIAKVQDASVRTSTGSVKGTYAYMAPEQLRGEKLDRRTDVFAMGIVLWELFARRHLFKRDTDFLTFQAITADPIPDISELRPDVPPQLCEVIAKALSRNRDDRQASARALGEELTKSVAMIGGVMGPSELSDLINAAFETRLRDQRKLIQVAREGGAMDLGEDLGPSVGHGTALVTTPVSMVSSVRSEVVVEAEFGPPRTPLVKPVDSKTAPAGAQGPRPTVMLPVARRSKAPLIALALIGLGAIGAVVYFLVLAPKGSEKVAEPGSGSVVRVAAQTPDASTAPSYNARPDAAEAPADAAVAIADAEVAAIDAAVVVTPPPVDAGVRKTDPVPPKPTGPPGFITIDSAPVYAVIFIDGRSYGETPLPRLSLSPGRHRVVAKSASGTTQSTTITIEPGKVAPAFRFKW